MFIRSIYCTEGIITIKKIRYTLQTYQMVIYPWVKSQTEGDMYNVQALTFIISFLCSCLFLLNLAVLQKALSLGFRVTGFATVTRKAMAPKPHVEIASLKIVMHCW